MLTHFQYNPVELLVFFCKLLLMTHIGYKEITLFYVFIELSSFLLMYKIKTKKNAFGKHKTKYHNERGNRDALISSLQVGGS